VSSAEAQRFAQVATTVTEAIKAIGPLDTKAFALQLAAVEAALSAEVLRWAVGKQVKTTTEGDVYGRKWDAATYEGILDKVLAREYQSSLIVQAIKAGHTAPRDISATTGLEVRLISYLIADMEKRSVVRFERMDNCKPVFAAA
jgi:hypothetical protein